MCIGRTKLSKCVLPLPITLSFDRSRSTSSYFFSPARGGGGGGGVREQHAHNAKYAPGLNNSFFSSHQQSVLQSATFRPGCPSHFQVCNRKRNCQPFYLLVVVAMATQQVLSLKHPQSSHRGEACSTHIEERHAVRVPIDLLLA